MNEKTNLVSAGARILGRTKRYLVCFYVLNLTLAGFGATGFFWQAEAVLSHSLYADRLLHGFDAAVLIEMLARPETGPLASSAMPAMLAALAFFLLSFLFMPGVLGGYASEERLAREEFFRACGSNLWRFVRLLILYAIIAGLIASTLFLIQGALVKAAGNSSHEKLPFYIRLVSLTVIFLIMTGIRAWFDVAQTDVVLRDQNRVRTSLQAGFHNTRRHLGRLLGSYVCVAIVALVILASGIWLWHRLVPAASVLGAFLVSQATLLTLLTMRFWQRAAAVAFHQRHMTEPNAAQPATTAPVIPACEGTSV